VPRPLPFLLIALAACGGPTPRDAGTPRTERDSGDSAFMLVQARGHTAMGVDQYTSTHRFEPLPDGGRISLQRDPGDSAGVAKIRRHMRRIADAFGRGDFNLPGFVHGREVPGTAVMTAGRARIDYLVDTLPGGGQLRLITGDQSVLVAIHEFLNFQRHDHRAGDATDH